MATGQIYGVTARGDPAHGIDHENNSSIIFPPTTAGGNGIANNTNNSELAGGSQRTDDESTLRNAKTKSVGISNQLHTNRTATAAEDSRAAMRAYQNN